MWGKLWESQSTKDRRRIISETLQKEHEAKVKEYNIANFRKGAIGVLVTGTLAVSASIFCRRSVIARRYVPNQFNANILPPKFNPMKDAARAVCDGTVLATSIFGFVVASSFWAYNAGSLKEFGRILTGKYSPERQIFTDPESDKVEKELTTMFFSKPSTSEK